ncbi:hypothetical protein B1A_16455, partial [mine drainage metagenome]
MSAESGTHWRIEHDAEGIVWLWADKADASANVLSSEVLRELDAHLERIRGMSPAGLVVLSAK